jgi:hypothetical protein
MNVNALSRKVTIGHYVATITEELEPLNSDYSRFMRLARTVGDLADIIDTGERDLVDVLGVVAAEAELWMEGLLAERAR